MAKTYSQGKRNAYFIADTNAMKHIWGGGNLATDESSFAYQAENDFKESISKCVNFLKKIADAQDRNIRQWIINLVKNGIIKVPMTISDLKGSDIERIYRIVQSMGGIRTQFQSKNYTKSAYSTIQQMVKKYDLYPVLRDAVERAVASKSPVLANITPDGLVVFNTTGMDRIVTQVVQNLAKKIASSVQYISNNGIEHNSIILKDQLKRYMGDRLLSLLEQSNLRASKNRKLVKAGKIDGYAGYKGVLEARIKTNRLARYDVAEYVTAALSSVYGLGGRHTGVDRTRIVQVADIDGTYFQEVQNKQDSVWNQSRIKSDIRVVFSTKAYGFRGKDENVEEVVRSSLVRGLNELKLQEPGSFYSRLQELNRTLNRESLENIRFAINNLSQSSLLRTNKENIEKALAGYFAAFMFNATFEQLKKVTKGRRNIYIFDVDGNFFTLAQISRKVAAQLSREKSSLSIISPVKIIPPSNLVADRVKGTLTMLDKQPPYATKDWADVRAFIEQQTQIKRVTMNLRAFMT